MSGQLTHTHKYIYIYIFPTGCWFQIMRTTMSERVTVDNATEVSKEDLQATTTVTSTRPSGCRDCSNDTIHSIVDILFDNDSIYAYDDSTTAKIDFKYIYTFYYYMYYYQAKACSRNNSKYTIN